LQLAAKICPTQPRQQQRIKVFLHVLRPVGKFFSNDFYPLDRDSIVLTG